VRVGERHRRFLAVGADETMAEKDPLLLDLGDHDRALHAVSAALQAYAATSGVPELPGGRRMSEGAANLVDHVLPDVPIRQFVLTLLFPLRFPLAFDGKLRGQVLRLFTDSVSGWSRKRHRSRGLPKLRFQLLQSRVPSIPRTTMMLRR
jgi:hypothetical protein